MSVFKCYLKDINQVDCHVETVYGGPGEEEDHTHSDEHSEKGFNMFTETCIYDQLFTKGWLSRNVSTHIFEILSHLNQLFPQLEHCKSVSFLALTV